MKAKSYWYGLVTLGALLFAAGYYTYQEYGSGNPGDNVLTLFGNVDKREVTLAFPVPGKVESVSVEEGDKVAAGDVVAKLEDGQYKDKLAIASAQVDASESELQILETGARDAEIEQAKASVARAKAVVDQAQATRDRLVALADRDVASHQAHETAQASLDEALAGLRGARAALRLAQEGPRAEEISKARASLAANRAARDIARRQLEDTKLVAPHEGDILTRVREPGSIVAAGEPIITLSLNSPVWVRTYVSEPDLGRIAPGQDVEIFTDSGRQYRGTIGFISPTAEFTPKSVETRSLRTSLVYRVRAVADNPDKGLKQGMPVTVQVQLSGQPE